MITKEIQLPFDVELLPVRKMKAGNLSCLYEAGNLRYIKCGDTEIIRMIYGAVRDENWETIPAIISGEKIEERENGFSIKYSAVYRAGNIHYRADFSRACYLFLERALHLSNALPRPGIRIIF